MANQADTGNVMLPRSGISFNTSGGPMGGTAGYMTLDGSSGYAADVVQQAQPNPTVTLGSTYGLGVWFETTSTHGGPLFEISTNPYNVAGGDDRVLYMNPSGTLSFIQNTGGTTTSTTATYNNGQWHFAYITLNAVNLILTGLDSTTTIYVDGTQAAQGGGVLVGYSADTGYWHLGWAPTSTTGLAVSYFTGSLSNFVVFDTANAPGDPSAAQLASQSAFNSWAATGSSPSPTEQWLLNDNGITTWTGTDPVIGTTSPCSLIDVMWAFTNPTSCAAIPESTTAACSGSETLAAFANGTWQAVSPPAGGSTQDSTISTAVVSGQTGATQSFIAGLHLYAPITWAVATVPASSWTVSCTWSTAASAFLA